MSKLFFTQFLTRRQTWFSLLWRNTWDVIYEKLTLFLLIYFVLLLQMNQESSYYCDTKASPCFACIFKLSLPHEGKGREIGSDPISWSSKLLSGLLKAEQGKQDFIARKEWCTDLSQVVQCNMPPVWLWKSLNPICPRSPHRSVERRS